MNAWLFGALALATVSANKGPGIAVLDLKGVGVLNTLTESGSLLVPTAVRKAAPGARIVAGSDIRAVLGLQQQKELLGCSDSGCMAELGGALGVDEIVSGELGKVGKRFVLELRRIDARKATSLASATRTFSSEDEFVDAIEAVTRDLYVGWVAPQPKPANASAPQRTLTPKIIAREPQSSAAANPNPDPALGLPVPPENAAPAEPTPPPEPSSPSTTPHAKPPLSAPAAATPASTPTDSGASTTTAKVALAGGWVLAALSGVGIVYARHVQSGYDAQQPGGLSADAASVTRGQASTARTLDIASLAALPVALGAIGYGTWGLVHARDTKVDIAPAAGKDTVGLALSGQF